MKWEQKGLHLFVASTPLFSLRVWAFSGDPHEPRTWHWEVRVNGARLAWGNGRGDDYGYAEAKAAAVEFYRETIRAELINMTGPERVEVFLGLYESLQEGTSGGLE